MRQRFVSCSEVPEKCPQCCGHVKTVDRPKTLRGALELKFKCKRHKVNTEQDV
jgi:hypothetical protein